MESNAILVYAPSWKDGGAVSSGLWFDSIALRQMLISTHTMKLDYAYQFKIDGLNHTPQFEKDKVDVVHDRILQQQMLKDRIDKERNKHFDPMNMKFDLPDTINNNSILDPEFMIFHGKI